MARVKVEAAAASEVQASPPTAEEEGKSGGEAGGEDDPFQGEDFHHWLSRHGGLNGGWTHDDHMVMVRLTHRYTYWPMVDLNLIIFALLNIGDPEPEGGRTNQLTIVAAIRSYLFNLFYSI